MDATTTAAEKGLLKTLELKDLLFFGVSNILSTGSAALVGNAILSGGKAWPFHIAGAATLLLGSSKTYTTALEKYKTNDAEGKLIEAEMGLTGSWLASIMIVLFNIVSTSVGLVFITRMLYPNASHLFSTMLAIQFALVLVAIGLYGIEVNRTIINSVSAIFIGIILIFVIFAVSKWFGGCHIQNVDLAATNGFSHSRAFLYIFFILAGFDVLIKFTEETIDERNVSRAFIGTNLLAPLMLIGLCFAYIVYVPLRGMKHADNTFADITKGIFGDSEGSIMKWVVISFIFVSALVNYVGLSRFVYSDLKDTMFEGWRELNSAQAPWKILLLLGAALIGCIAVNNIDKLVAGADLFLVAVLAMVGWSAARAKLKDGKKPWIESLTTLGLFTVGGISIKQLFKNSDKTDYSAVV